METVVYKSDKMMVVEKKDLSKVLADGWKKSRNVIVEPKKSKPKKIGRK